MNFNEASVCRSVGNNNTVNNGRSKMKKKKRFSDEQIRSLEVMFGSEAKPDPGLKQQLAAELGLQPRQVAIWFQNRRARLKPKQIEREYDSLKVSYDALTSKCELLKKENQSLTVQLRTLVEKFERVGMEKSGRMNDELNMSETIEQASQQNQTHQQMDEYHQGGHNNEQDQKMRVMEQQQVSGIPMELMYTSSANSWSSGYSCFLDQSSCSSSQQWWEFW